MKHYSFALVAVLMLAGGMWGAETDKAEWSVRSYACPGDSFHNMFVVEERGRVHLPRVPAEDAGLEEIKAFIKSSSTVFREIVPELPDGSLVVLDSARHTLAARTTEVGHWGIEGMLRKRVGSLPSMITMQVDLLDAPVDEVQKLMKETAGVSDHTVQLQRFEEAGAKLVASAKLETKSGQRATTEMVTMVDHVTEFAARADGSTEAVRSEQEPVGLLVEVDPLIGSYGKTLEVNLSVKHSETAGTLRMVPLGTLAGEGGVQDFVKVNWKLSTTIMPGQSRMVGVCPGNNSARARVCFLTAFCSKVQFAINELAEGWLKKYGDAVEAMTDVKKFDPWHPTGMIMKSIFVPSYSTHKKKSGVATPVVPFAIQAPDPFAIIPQDPFGSSVRIEIETGRDVEDPLKEQGLPFPDGARVFYDGIDGYLRIINTPENAALIEAFVDSEGGVYPRVIQMCVHVVEAPSAVVQKLGRQSLALTDHRVAWEALQVEVTAGRGRMVGFGAIETKSGQRCILESGRWFANVSAHQSGQLPEAKAGDGSVAGVIATVEHVPLGLRFEVEPTLWTDVHTLDINLSVERQSREPTERFEVPVTGEGVLRVDAPTVDFHPQKIVTALTTVDGMWRMIGTWQPAGADGNLDPSVMQAVFLQAVVMTVDFGE